MGIRYSDYIVSSNSSTSSYSTSSSSSFSSNDITTYTCRSCQTHLSNSDLILSKGYRGSTGIAYLMDKVINVKLSNRGYKTMLSGKYLVSDICCHQCDQLVGWKYHLSEDVRQRYKEGKYVLELNTVSCIYGW